MSDQRVPVQANFRFDDRADEAQHSLALLETLFEAWIGARSRNLQPLAASSIAVYRPMWRAFAMFLSDEGGTLDALDPALLDRYIAKRELAPRYARRVLVLIDWLCAFDAQREEKPRNSSAQVVLQRPGYRLAEAKRRIPLPETLTDAQAQALIQRIIAPVEVGDWVHLRNNAMVGVMLGAGLKPGETLVLTLGAIGFSGVDSDPRREPIKLSLPGHAAGAARETPLAPYARQVLAAWLSVRASLDLRDDIVFPSGRHGGVLAKTTLYRHYGALLSAAGIWTDKRGAHALRHTFAVRNLKKGRSVQTISDWLGLETVDSAERYRRIVSGDVNVI